MLLRPSEKGVLPSSGTSMIGFEKMTIDVEAQHAQTEETVQVLDVREAMKEVGSDKARIFASVKFNQSFGNSHEGAEFGLVLQAYKKEQKNEEVELVRLEKKLASDRDPNTWSGLSSELEIPVDAEYLVVSLSARKQGPDARWPQGGATEARIHAPLGPGPQPAPIPPLPPYRRKPTPPPKVENRVASTNACAVAWGGWSRKRGVKAR